ncbi:beta-glucosidase 40-like [Impatiens glandulifera]|uniref:beta-glucosidase 40-like n=1 Tax=Impatiens glandulifera TaxID=253017 RepID=UPI001FB066ED|nr:beta-glucosidase 40-like [Impatiens glandulifera]
MDVTALIMILLALLWQPCFSDQIMRSSFPKGFVFGTASSSYQYEGAVKEGGRGPTIWDKFTHKSWNIHDGSNGDVAVDQYHLYNEDIKLMKDLGVDAYRFSIAWSRIFPNGTGLINQAGVDHYNTFINALLANGIQPYVTLYHWDLPLALEDRYGGWLDSQIVEDFAVYADTCFQKFGDRVKEWVTFNEPHTVAMTGYDLGIHAPGRCSIFLHLLCKSGNSSTEPYIVAHNMINAHAIAAKIYRRRYKVAQKGSIGVAFNVIWFEPLTNSTSDIEAAQRAQDFQLGWFLDPMMFGDYPESMISRVGSRLPRFTKKQSRLVKGSLDYVGINHYTTFYAHNIKSKTINYLLKDVVADSGALTLPFKGFKPIGERANSIWLYLVPKGMRSLMNYIKEKYDNPPVVITENGMDDGNSMFISIKNALNDQKRIRYHEGYLSNLLASIKEDGCNVKGYFVWSLLDNWEWAAGYTSRFGLYFVDYKNKLKRYPKNSVKWFSQFLSN